jgi:hypothetical protein
VPLLLLIEICGRVLRFLIEHIIAGWGGSLLSSQQFGSRVSLDSGQLGRDTVGPGTSGLLGPWTL